MTIHETAPPDTPDYVPPAAGMPPRPVSVTSIGVPAMDAEPGSHAQSSNGQNRSGTAHAVLIVERGDSPGTEFRLVADDSTIGRWDADNGVFPDVDLDAYDSDAKVSRRHARIYRRDGAYFVEDLGSTNGTYVNRGRRLLPGNAQPLNEGDEIIVGKTFLRFRIVQ